MGRPIANSLLDERPPITTDPTDHKHHKTSTRADAHEHTEPARSRPPLHTKSRVSVTKPRLCSPPRRRTPTPTPISTSNDKRKERQRWQKQTRRSTSTRSLIDC